MIGTRSLQSARVGFLAAGFLLLGLLTAAPAAQALSLDDIIRLKLAGVEEETILRVVDAEEAVFYLSVEDILDLKDAGASDDFIRELMDTPERFPGSEYRSTDDIYIHGYEPFDNNDYATVFTHYYYDPFAYYWYPWPRFYAYYSPFWWTNCGFYFAGHWCWDWSDPWGSCYWYCDRNYGYCHYFGPSRTRVRARGSEWRAAGAGGATGRLSRQRAIWRQADLSEPRTTRVRAPSTSARLTRPTTHRASSDKIARPTYRSSNRSGRATGKSRTVAEKGRSPSTRSYRSRQQSAARDAQLGSERSRSRSSSRPARSDAPAYRRDNGRQSSPRSSSRSSSSSVGRSPTPSQPAAPRSTPRNSSIGRSGAKGRSNVGQCGSAVRGSRTSRGSS